MRLINAREVKDWAASCPRFAGICCALCPWYLACSIREPPFSVRAPARPLPVLASLDPQVASGADVLTDCNFNNLLSRHSVSLGSLMDYVLFYVILGLVSMHLGCALMGVRLWMEGQGRCDGRRVPYL